MEKEFVPYEIALELKQLGFDEPCFFAFDNCSTPMRCSDLRTNKQKFYGVNYNSSTYTSQPTYSQAFRWFEENYSYFVDIRTDTTPNEILGFDYTIKSWKFPPMFFGFFNDKGEGNIEVINKMIEMVKKEKQKEILIDLMNMDDDDKNK